MVDPNDPNYDSEAEHGEVEVEDTIFDKILRGDIPSKKAPRGDPGRALVAIRWCTIKRFNGDYFMDGAAPADGVPSSA